MKILLIEFLVIFLLTTTEVLSQEQIQYGSNNGKYISIFNTKVYYEEYGKGMPLILLEGGYTSIKSFSKSIPELSKYFRVIIPDTPGQGKSEAPDSMTYSFMAEYISKMIDLLKLDSAYVLGWSDGGNMALILASKRPDKIKKVLAYGAGTRLDGATKRAQDFINGITYEEMQKISWSDHQISPKFFADIVKMWRTDIWVPQNLLENTKIPVMIAIGDKDITTLEHGIEMHRLIKNSQFCVLPNTTHFVFIQSPSLINQITIDFFKK